VVTWPSFWNALVHNGAIPAAGIALLIVGATVRWFEPLCRFLGRLSSGFDPFRGTLAYTATLRADGDEQGASRAEERLRDQRRRLERCGRLMLLAGGAVVVMAGLFHLY